MIDAISMFLTDIGKHLLFCGIQKKLDVTGAYLLKRGVFAVLQVKFEESEMIPKSGKSPADSRKSVGIHEFAALARSSLNGNNLLPFLCFKTL